MYTSTNPRIHKIFKDYEEYLKQTENDRKERVAKKARVAHQLFDSRPKPYKRPSTSTRNAVNKELDRQEALKKIPKFGGKRRTTKNRKQKKSKKQRKLNKKRRNTKKR